MKFDLRVIFSKCRNFFSTISFNSYTDKKSSSSDTLVSSSSFADEAVEEKDVSWGSIVDSEIDVTPPTVKGKDVSNLSIHSDMNAVKKRKKDNKEKQGTVRKLSGTDEDFLKDYEKEKEEVAEVKEEIPWKYRNKKLKICLTVFIVLLGIIHSFAFPKGIFYVNYTVSAPRGVYVRNFFEPWKKGDTVMVVTPYKLANFEKGYVMLKTVAGTYGDKYEVTDDCLILENGKYPIHRELKQLPQLSNGIYYVPQFQVLLLNDIDESFDSRYFGPLPQSSVKGRLDLLFTFSSIERKFDFVPTWLKERLRDRLIPAKRKTA